MADNENDDRIKEMMMMMMTTFMIMMMMIAVLRKSHTLIKLMGHGVEG